MHTRSNTTDDEGFTLLELLLVLAILALSSYFALPLLTRPASDATLTATAQRLANDMRTARAAAIRDNIERTLTIDVAKRLFWVDGLTKPTAIPNGVSIDLVTLQDQQLSGRQGQLRFFVDGSTSGGNVILKAGQRVLNIQLDWMTGHASMAKGR